LAQKLVFDATQSGPLGRTVVERAPLVLLEDEPLRLRIYVDRSVVEVYANERQAITRRVYPDREDSDRVRLTCQGGPATFTEIRTWEMMPSNSW
jgi:beta-fructofuranosidase